MKKKWQRGYSFAELMIALLVVMNIILFITQLYSTVNKADAESWRGVQAAYWAQAALEEMWAQPYDLPSSATDPLATPAPVTFVDSSDPNNWPPTLQKVRTSFSNSDSLYEVIPVLGSDGAEVGKQVSIRMIWSEGGKTKSYSVVVFRKR